MALLFSSINFQFMDVIQLGHTKKSVVKYESVAPSYDHLNTTLVI